MMVNIQEIRRKQILELCKTCLEYYMDYLTIEDITNINNILNIINGNFNLKSIEDILLPIVEKIWENELNSGNYIVISWNKYSSNKPNSLITFATLSTKDNIVPFCDLENGIEYEISYNSIIGAFWKDGATLIENIDRKNDYTIKVIGDKVINSYNGATKLITPIQLVQERDIDYLSKHNELILDTRYIRKISSFDLSSNSKLGNK